MPWFKVDDKFGDHPKVRRLGKDIVPAVGLWTLCGTWCSNNVTTTTLDGFVPASVVRRYDPRLRLARRLAEVGLWDEIRHESELGFRFHQWNERQPTREEVEEKRAANTAKVADWRKRNAGRRAGRPAGNPSGNPVTNPVGNPSGNPAPVPVPGPSSPSGEEPSLRSGGTRERATPSKKRGTRIPDDFAPTPEMVEWARQKTPLVGRYETEQFIDYWRGIPGAKGEKVDWVATWRRWMRETQSRAEERGKVRSGSPTPTGSRRMDKVLSALDPDDPFLSEYHQQPQGRPVQDGLMIIEGGRSA